MTKFFAGVLSVIAVGILLVAYGLLNLSASALEPRETMSMDPFARPMNASERMLLPQDPYAARYVYSDGSVATVPYGYAPYAAQSVGYQMNDARPVRTVAMAPAPRRVAAQTADRRPRRDWKKTALVIGGSTAGGAGVGGIFGGKKGALIGAAIGGGASTVYEAMKR